MTPDESIWKLLENCSGLQQVVLLSHSGSGDMSLTPPGTVRIVIAWFLLSTPPPTVSVWHPAADQSFL